MSVWEGAKERIRTVVTHPDKGLDPIETPTQGMLTVQLSSVLLRRILRPLTLLLELLWLAEASQESDINYIFGSKTMLLLHKQTAAAVTPQRCQIAHAILCDTDSHKSRSPKDHFRGGGDGGVGWGSQCVVCNPAPSCCCFPLAAVQQMVWAIVC